MCGFCEAIGHGECDWCGGPTWEGDRENGRNRYRVDDETVCWYCHVDPSRKVLRNA